MIHRNLTPQKRISIWETGVVAGGQQMELYLPLQEEGKATDAVKYPLGLIVWISCVSFSLGFWGYIASLI